MLAAFTLSMPGIGSWDGKWTGSSGCYVIVRSLGKNEAGRAFNTGDGEGYHHYSFGDGWAAGVRVQEVNANGASRLRHKSDGFCGYDWMVESIMREGKIVAGTVQP